MFRINWSKDKTGFLTTWILLGIFLSAAISLIVLVVLATYQGDWEPYSIAFMGVIIAWWVLSMVTVIVRIAIYRTWMVRKREQLKREEQNKVES